MELINVKTVRHSQMPDTKDTALNRYCEEKNKTVLVLYTVKYFKTSIKYTLHGRTAQKPISITIK